MNSSSTASNLRRSKAILDVVPKVMRVIRAEMRFVGKSSLTVPQFRILTRLTRSSMSNQELAEWIGVSPPTMSRMVDKLVQRKLLSRKVGSSDRRQIIVEATRQGTALSNRMRSVVEKKFSKQLSHFPESRLQTIEAALELLKEAFL